MSGSVVPVSECDYLEEDAEIRGQKFCCLSFLSPEKVLDDKEVFRFTKFTENFCKEVNEMFYNLKEKYPDDADGFQAIADRYRFLFNKKHMQDEYKYFMDEKSEEIDKEFSETVDFKTNVRGIKVRGSYDSMREAQIRSEVLKRKDKTHNIFIAQVGCWCPWDPCADQIDDQHYGEDQLNTLMKKYRENQAHKDEVFDERKDEMIEAQKEKNKKTQEQNQLEAPTTEEEVKDSENEVIGEVKDTVQDVSKTVVDTADAVKDVTKTVSDVESGNVVQAATDVVADVKDVEQVVSDVEQVVKDVKGDVQQVITSSGVGEDNTVEENFNVDTNPDINEKVFGGEDIWMKSKGSVEEVD
jgi:hypothetical protein